MLDFIYNPIAGSGNAARARSAIEPLLTNIPHRFHETLHEKHALKIASALTEGGRPAEIVTMGGDGTLNEVLNGIVDPSQVQLGLIPCGSGNDFAAAAGLPSDPAEALKLILSGKTRFTDYMECSGIRGINAIGTGIDVDILRRYNRMKLLKGSAAYLAALILTVLTYKARRFEDITGGNPLPHHAFIACAGNGQSIGGGIPVCPESIIDDGLLDVIIVDNIRKPAIPAAFMKLMHRKVRDIPSTSFSRRSSLKIRADRPMPIQIDGEIYEDLPFDVHLVHGVLRFFRP